MITSIIRLFLVLAFGATASLFAASDDVILTASVVTARKADADLFLTSIGGSVVTREQVAALIKRGSLAGTVTMRGQSGTRFDGGSTKFRVEADVTVNGGVADMIIVPQEGGKPGKPAYKVFTSLKIKLGTIQLLGVSDEPGDGPSRLYFLSVQ